VAEDVGIRERESLGVVVLVGEDSLGNVPRRQADMAMRPWSAGLAGPGRCGLVIEAVKVGGGDQIDEIAVSVLVLAEKHEVVVAVGIGACLVAFLRDVNFAADTGWTPLALAAL